MARLLAAELAASPALAGEALPLLASLPAWVSEPDSDGTTLTEMTGCLLAPSATGCPGWEWCFSLNRREGGLRSHSLCAERVLRRESR